ncbi:MAG: mechanosensitive ion channel family protein [Myxococcales bacterium]|nr:mechanosensitive ion channel family protein [Myxococcales bacterium]
MSDLLDKAYYNNTVLEWATAMGIMLGALIAGKVLYWVCSSVIKKVTAKTRSNLDDLIVDLAEEPIIVGLSLVGVMVGVGTLNLSAGAESWAAGFRQFIIMMSITWLVARLVEAVFSELIAPIADKSENDLDDQLLPLVRKGTKVFVWSLGTIVALNNAGYDVGALIAGLGIGGLALAMAAKDTVSNIFGGFTVFTDRPFVVGDRVKVSGYDGAIMEVGIRSTRLKTLEGRVVTIPNATFSDTAVENVTLEPSRKVAVDLGLTYETTPEGLKKALQIVKEITESTEGLEENFVSGFDSFGDSAMVIKYIYYIRKDADIMATKTEVNMKILERFTEAKLDFAFPSQTIYTQAA